MTDCEGRVQAFAVAMREEAYTNEITERGRTVLEATIREVLGRAGSATTQGCESILARLKANVDSLQKAGEIKQPAGDRLRSLLVALNPTHSSGAPAGGGIIQAAPGGRSMYLFLALGIVASGVVWWFLRKKR